MKMISLFSGFGLADEGYKAAGFIPIGAVEYKPELAAVYAKNHGDHVLVADVRDVDYSQFESPDLLHASPVCTNASVANVNGGETELDRDCARATTRAIQTLMPPVFVMENVYAYRNFESYEIICMKLRELGYAFNMWHLNAANYGVPQTRQRLILIARRDGITPSIPERTHAQKPIVSLFGTLNKWVGWYEAIEDLIPNLPESQFAEWQLKRMQDFGAESIMVECQNSSRDATIRKITEPAITITCASLRRPSSGLGAFICSDQSGHEGFSIPIRMEDEPMFTVVASSDCEPIRAETGVSRVVRMTPRALARFQSVPDSFELSGHRKTDSIGIGNGVPCLLTQRIGEHVKRWL